MANFVGEILDTPLYKMLKGQYICYSVPLVDEVLAAEGTLHQCNRDTFEDKLWLLTGSPRLTEFEHQISQAVGPAGSKVDDCNFIPVGTISYIMNKLTERHGFDVILLDVSPSNSALNQCAAISCDYILPPCCASLYSCGSVAGLLNNVLPGTKGWLGKHAVISQVQYNPVWIAENANMLAHRLPEQKPKLLPILVNSYGLETVDEEPVPSDSARPHCRRAARLNGPTLVKKRVRFAPTQFIYTLIHFLNNECPYIEGGRESISATAR